MSMSRVVHGFIKYIHDVAWPAVQAEERMKREARNGGARGVVVARSVKRKVMV